MACAGAVPRGLKMEGTGGTRGRSCTLVACIFQSGDTAEHYVASVCTPCIKCPTAECSVRTRQGLGVDPVKAILAAFWEPFLCLILTGFAFVNGTYRIQSAHDTP